MEKTTTGDFNFQQAVITRQILKKAGVRYACISPGSRNTPLTLAFASDPDINSISIIDERSAGYFALGLARASRTPVVLICTSGTAAANYTPAVVEANYSRIPLIVITADRPGNLVGSGANQTIHQKDIYGVHVRYFRDLGFRQPEKELLIQGIVSAVLMAQGMNAAGEFVNPPGPVHLNFPFDEPLVPEKLLLTPEMDSALSHVTIPERRTAHRDEGVNLTGEFHCPLIVCGRMNDADHVESVLRLSEYLNAPVFADPASQLRFGVEHPNVISTYDLFLKTRSVTPDVVIRFGAKPTSKLLCRLLDEWEAPCFLIDPAGRFNDDCETVIPADIPIFCEKLITTESLQPGDPRWLQEIIHLHKITRDTVDGFFARTPLFEGSVSAVVLSELQDGDHLTVGNSMPVRDMDMFASGTGTRVHIYVNRGTSGIDGVMSSALGMAFHNGAVNHAGRNFLIIGDLSFFYDLNALMTAARVDVEITILVINNDGGGIFSFLPVADKGYDEFREFWTTPHNLSVVKAAALYGCRYARAESEMDLRNLMRRLRQEDGVKIIEVKSDIRQNVDLHREISRQVANALKK